MLLVSYFMFSTSGEAISFTTHQSRFRRVIRSRASEINAFASTGFRCIPQLSLLLYFSPHSQIPPRNRTSPQHPPNPNPPTTLTQSPAPASTSSINPPSRSPPNNAHHSHPSPQTHSPNSPLGTKVRRLITPLNTPRVQRRARHAQRPASPSPPQTPLEQQHAIPASARPSR